MHGIKSPLSGRSQLSPTVFSSNLAGSSYPLHPSEPSFRSVCLFSLSSIHQPAVLVCEHSRLFGYRFRIVLQPARQPLGLGNKSTLAKPQREWLARLGCCACQGYLFSRPLPVEGFELMLSKVPCATAPRIV
jgi:hypothetical protein